MVGHSLGGLTITQVAERLSEQSGVGRIPDGGDAREWPERAPTLPRFEGPDNAVASNRILSEDQPVGDHARREFIQADILW